MTKEKNNKTITGVMTQEEKELLLKDLCARLPYGVKCRFETTIDTYKTIEFSREGTNGRLVDFDELYCYWFNEGFILPYLRPMSSMTEEEFLEYHNIKYNKVTYTHNWKRFDVGKFHDVGIIPIEEYLDWLNAHHFDYRDLIPKGLALEAPEGMYNI